MKKIITLGASSSKTSINKQLAEYAGRLLNNVEVLNLDLNDFEMPLFSVDLEAEQGFPAGAKKLNEQINEVDGFIISFAEHNGAYSTAFKNAFDWLSRIEGKVWRNKPMLLLSTSPGARGGATVLEIAKGRFPYMGGIIVESMPFGSFYENFNDGTVVNGELKAELSTKVEAFENAL